MKNYFKILLSTAIIALIAISCGPKYETPEINGLEKYTDKVNEMSILFPKNWKVIPTPGRNVVCVTNKGALQSYMSYNPNSVPGAYIRLVSYKLDTNKTLESIINTHKESLAGAKPDVKNITIDGAKGISFEYNFGLENGTVNGFRYIAAKDSGTATELTIECYGSAYETYKENIDKIIKSFKLAITPKAKAQDTILQQEEADPPTLTLATKSGDGFSIGIPDNFFDEKAQGMKGALKTYNWAGERRGDCNIRIDVLDGSKVSNLKSQVDKNKEAYGGKDASKTTLGGKEAYKYSYNPTAKHTGYVWYVLSNKKLYIVSMIYFKEEADNYKAPFEKSINSIKFN